LSGLTVLWAEVLDLLRREVSRVLPAARSVGHIAVLEASTRCFSPPVVPLTPAIAAFLVLSELPGRAPELTEGDFAVLRKNRLRLLSTLPIREILPALIWLLLPVVVRFVEFAVDFPLPKEPLEKGRGIVMLLDPDTRALLLVVPLDGRLITIRPGRRKPDMTVLVELPRPKVLERLDINRDEDNRVGELTLMEDLLMVGALTRVGVMLPAEDRRTVEGAGAARARWLL